MRYRCIDNAGFETSLTLGKTYEAVGEIGSDEILTESILLRVIDDTGTEFEYPLEIFEETR